MNGPARQRLPDGRLHLQHGPIDLVIEAWGAASEVEAAYAQAAKRFDSVLEELVSELPRLREGLGAAFPMLRGRVAKRMVAACWPHRAVFLTPMAAVAGAVADEVLAAMLAGCALRKAYVNDGGDIAVHVAHGESLSAGIVENVERPSLDAGLRMERPCGLATSGWRGRSQSLGIADSVTVLAGSAAAADAAATLSANAVDVHHPGIERRPAHQLREDSDLGERLVTVAVPPLPPGAADAALDSGLELARQMLRRGLIQGAYLALQSRSRAVQAGTRQLGDTACPPLDATS
ncbi:MAG: UPF0280 family protein [Acidobacteria bacterium]|nr:UPF0280 family protein [Acidobacteriota bacterium]